jgi:hypothetical protein
MMSKAIYDNVENGMAKLPAPDSLTEDWAISHACPLDFDVRSGNDAKEAAPKLIALFKSTAGYRHDPRLFIRQMS